MVPLLVCSSPWQMSHSSGISNILGSLQFHPDTTFTTSCNERPPWREIPATRISWLQLTLCNLGGGFHNLVTYLSVMTLNPALQGWDCWEGAGPLWVTLAGAFVCCSFLEAENSLRHGLYNLEAYPGRVSWGCLFLYSKTDLNLINRTNLSTFNKP